MRQDVLKQCDEVPELLRRYEHLRSRAPSISPPIAAKQLGVSEAELVAARCGRDVRRLDGEWGDLLRRLPSLGPVMILTRNDSASHERTGSFKNVSVFGDHALVLGGAIDLRINLGAWRFGYAVTDIHRGAVRRSFQFFDVTGSAALQIYLCDDSDSNAYARLANCHTTADQSTSEVVAAALHLTNTIPASPKDVLAFRDGWRGLRDASEFAGLLRDFDLGRVQAFRLAGAEFVDQVEPEGFCLALRGAAAEALPVRINVPSRSVVQIHSGPIHTVRNIDGWVQVLDGDFNLRIREAGIGSAWVVRKPTKSGQVTCLEIFDSQDRQIAWILAPRHHEVAEMPQWRALLAGLPRKSTAEQGRGAP